MFSEKIIRWYEDNKRVLPWRGIRDPYRIWVSEIILQQTRIEQGRSYYERFVDAYPTVTDLANASEEQVLKLWQGLGYYSRARNMHSAARHIAFDLDGHFPATYEGVLALKGVGRYTAAAIVSFAYRLPYPVIDGNVYRVMARIFGITLPIATETAYKEFERHLMGLIDRDRPDLFNQAMMDFGATYCKPVGCNCGECIFSSECVAWNTGRVSSLPVRPAAIKVRQRYFYYLDIRWVQDGVTHTFFHQRQGRDIWKGLYEYPLIESNQTWTDEQLQNSVSEWFNASCGAQAIRPYMVMSMTHKLTHQTLSASFIRIDLSAPPSHYPEKELGLPLDRLKSLPVPRLIDNYFQNGL
ncbi:MAG: A/G-specific adenine glycosylase [Bacteroidales bacterium]|nr:A/G-specific adenine glycosylase [Bacteroidales bacterium]